MQILLLDRQKAKLALQGEALDLQRSFSYCDLTYVFWGGGGNYDNIFFPPLQKCTIHDVSLKSQIFEKKKKRRLDKKSCVSKFVRDL